MAKIAKVIVKPVEKKDIKKLQKKLVFAREKPDPKLKEKDDKVPAEVELTLLKSATENLKKEFEKELAKNANLQKYANYLEEERDRVAKLNEELVDFANKKIQITWCERLIVAFLWIASVFVMWYYNK